MRHIIGTTIIFLILLVEDFFMGMFGGYTATGGGDIFVYLSSVTIEHMAVIFVASIIIYLILRRIFKI